MSTNRGFQVKTQDGKIGRTYHHKGQINNKVPVYIEGEDKPRLCDPKTLKVIGFID
jgi:hypothetical protein